MATPDMKTQEDRDEDLCCRWAGRVFCKALMLQSQKDPLGFMAWAATVPYPEFLPSPDQIAVMALKKEKEEAKVRKRTREEEEEDGVFKRLRDGTYVDKELWAIHGADNYLDKIHGADGQGSSVVE
jgi:hypothetical protein